MTQLPAPAGKLRRTVPLWAAILMAVGSLALGVGLTIAAIAVSIAGFGAAATVDDAPAPASSSLDQVDPAGADACRYLDMALGGVGTFGHARELAAGAGDPRIRAAVSNYELYQACVQAGANMSPWPEFVPTQD